MGLGLFMRDQITYNCVSSSFNRMSVQQKTNEHLQQQQQKPAEKMKIKFDRKKISFQFNCKHFKLFIMHGECVQTKIIK